MLNQLVLNILKKSKQDADLSKKLLSDEILKEIVDELNNNYPNITDLNLAHNAVRDPGLKYLAELKHVERLDLTDTHINSAAEIKALLNSKIKTFILDDCNLNSDVQEIILEATQAGKTISLAKCTFVDTTALRF